MGKIHIIKNELIDFSIVLEELTNLVNLDYQAEYNVELLNDYQKYCSKLLLNDLNYFVKKLLVNNIIKYACFNLALTDFSLMMDYLKQLSNKDLINLYVQSLIEENYFNNESHIEKLINQDDYLMHANYQYSSLIEFVKQIEQIKPRLFNLFSDVYQQVYLPMKEKLAKLNQEKSNKLQQIAVDDYDNFCKLFIVANSADFKINDDYQALFYVVNGTKNYYSCTFLKNNPKNMYIIFSLDLLAEYYKDQTSKVLTYLGDVTKQKIINLLAQKPYYASEIATELNLNRATISHHLGQLTIVKLIDIKYQSGKRTYYELNLDQLEKYFTHYLATLSNQQVNSYEK